MSLVIFLVYLTATQKLSANLLLVMDGDQGCRLGSIEGTGSFAIDLSKARISPEISMLMILDLSADFYTNDYETLMMSLHFLKEVDKSALK